jgi:NAD(P)-dependent dehydrogenase (short-subunit alcohol dehydrogenase family)
MTDRVAGRIALVTGAGSGIGAASAAALSAEGASIIVTDIREDAASAVAAQIVAAGGRATSWALDVVNEDDWRATIERSAADLGPITILHSNAALTSREAYDGDLGVVDLSMALFDSVIDVNLKGSVLGCKYVIPGMIEAGGGSIILMSSVKASSGSAYRTAYSVSKGGIDSLARVVATGYGKSGVRCNAIAPGIVLTAANAAMPEDQLLALRAAHLTPQLGTTQDIASAVLYLASDEAKFVTGQVLCVDGGLAAHTEALSPAGSRTEN